MFFIRCFLVTLLVAIAPRVFAAEAVRPFVAGSLAKIVAERQGKPFVLAFWSVGCAHCPLELKALGEIRQRNRQLDIVLVAADSPEEAPLIAQLAARYGLVKVEQWVFADEMQERLRQLKERSEQMQARLDELKNRPGEILAARQALLDTLSQLEGLKNIAADKLAAAERELDETNKGLKIAEASLMEVRERRAHAQAMIEGAAGSLEVLGQSVQDQFSMTPEQLWEQSDLTK